MTVINRFTKPFTPIVLIAGFTLLLISNECLGQGKSSLDSTQINLLDVAREIMMASKTCTLITMDKEGRPAARIMDPFPPDEDFTVWFGTNPKSRKVGQIEHDPRVTLLYVSQDISGYVMVQGTARTVNAPEEKARHWKSVWEQFYPDKEENYLLIRVTPLRFEVVSYPHGITGDAVTWEPQSVTLHQN